MIIRICIVKTLLKKKAMIKTIVKGKEYNIFLKIIRPLELPVLLETLLVKPNGTKNGLRKREYYISILVLSSSYRHDYVFSTLQLINLSMSEFQCCIFTFSMYLIVTLYE